MERRGQEYICPPCTTKKQSQVQPEPHPQPEPELSSPKCLTQSPSGEEVEGHDEQQALKVRIAFGLPVISQAHCTQLQQNIHGFLLLSKYFLLIFTLDMYLQWHSMLRNKCINKDLQIKHSMHTIKCK